MSTPACVVGPIVRLPLLEIEALFPPDTATGPERLLLVLAREIVLLTGADSVVFPGVDSSARDARIFPATEARSREPPFRNVLPVKVKSLPASMLTPLALPRMLELTMTSPVAPVALSRSEPVPPLFTGALTVSGALVTSTAMVPVCPERLPRPPVMVVSVELVIRMSPLVPL